MEFKKNELMNEVLKNYYETFAMTLDTNDFTPAKYNKKIYKYIFRNFKKKWKEVNVEYKKYKKEIEKTSKKKIGLFQKIKLFFERRFKSKRKKK